MQRFISLILLLAGCSLQVHGKKMLMDRQQNGTATATTTTTTTSVPNPGEVYPAVCGSDGPTITADSNGAVTIDDQTLTLGGEITVSGISTIGLNATDGGLICEALITTKTIMTVDGQTLAENPNGYFSFAPNELLTSGGQVTISGTTFSMDPSGSFVVINGATQTLATIDASITAGLVPTLSFPRSTPASQTSTGGAMATFPAGGKLSRDSGVAVACIALLNILM